MGPYYLTALVNLLGPAKEVTSISSKGVGKRTIGIGPKKGKRFKVECPTTYFSTIKFHNGTIIRLTLSFDVISLGTYRTLWRKWFYDSSRPKYVWWICFNR